MGRAKWPGRVYNQLHCCGRMGSNDLKTKSQPADRTTIWQAVEVAKSNKCFWFRSTINEFIIMQID